MNLRLLVSPWILMAAAVIGVVALTARALVGQALREMMQRRPWTAHGLPAILAAAGASLLFKDSGVVTVAFLVGGTFLILLYYSLIGTPENASE